MAADTAIDVGNTETVKKGRSKFGLILSIILCLSGAGAGFYGVSSGLIPTDFSTSSENDQTRPMESSPDIKFVDIPTLIVTLPPEAENDHLRFSAKIEVPTDFVEDVEFLMPRIQDAMNGYLRALVAADIEGPGSIFRIRLQIFRRIATIVGEDKANGLLITEFILR